ncbi:MAG: sugar transferase [Saccharofermentanales bacterium]
MYKKVKRIGDIILSGIGIIILLPVFLLIALIIKIESPGPVFFKQKRIGINKSNFMIYKFRTMRNDTPKDTPTHLLENPGRFITKSGGFLRKSSLDELPQIFNIFKGEMSIIGPRPALWNQDDLIEQRDIYNANSVIPGLTGWAQVNGRDELPIPVKAQMDGFYVSNCSFGLDLKIFWYTIRNIITRKGIVEGKNQP